MISATAMKAGRKIDEKPPKRAALRGSNQLGVRQHNERLMLSLIRQHEQISKAEIAKLSGLSAQTVTVIVRHLEQQKLVLKQKPQKGKVGQPQVPFRLNPDGAYAIGLKVGRRSIDLMLIDLLGKTRKIVRQPYHFPSPEQFIMFAKTGLETLLAEFSRSDRKKIMGLGIASPFQLWNWEEETGAPKRVLEAWRDFDITSALQEISPFTVYPCNDATAACAAELLFGRGHKTRDYAYFYVGHFIGGGLVLDGSIYQGRSGNAAAFGSILVPKRKEAGSQQLIRAASLAGLERRIVAKGFDAKLLLSDEHNWFDLGQELQEWLEDSAFGIAHAIIAVSAANECAEFVIDGAFPPAIRTALVNEVKVMLAALNQSGLTAFTLNAGGIGRDARAFGAASLPLFANFIIDRDVIFKEA